jgi:pimeloyl-ACP methyl ester carboxylesterase
MNGRALRAPERGPEAETPDAWSRLGEVAVPTLVMVGALDAEEIVAIAPQVADRIPGAELQQLDGVAHVPHLEGDENTLCWIRTFADAGGSTLRPV